MIVAATAHLNNVSVVVGEGYTADFAKQHGYTLIRGYRDDEDLAYEREMAEFNLARGGIETELFLTTPNFAEISSTAVRGAFLAGDMARVENMVPEGCFQILVALKDKM